MASAAASASGSQMQSQTLAQSSSNASIGTGTDSMRKSASAPSIIASTDAWGNEVKRYKGNLQQVLPRVTKRAPVNFDKGGSDFRCPHDASSIGKQPLAWPHTASSGNYRFATQNRFMQEKHRSPGPRYGHPSSLGKQPASKRTSMPSYGFGTSTRDGALKQYAVWSFR